MKICIVTQPLRHNYGGILQAYALQRTLREMGHDVVTDRYGAPRRNYPTPKRLLKLTSCSFKRYILGNVKIDPTQYIRYPKRRGQDAKYASFDNFVDKNFKTVDLFKGRFVLPRAEVECYDAFVAGSDQIWRRIYSNPETYFLDFASKYNVRRVAYAGSFGKDNVDDYKASNLAKSKAAAKRLDLISVREDSGVEVCRDIFDVEAIHVLDPTLLLDAQNYNELTEEIPTNKGSMMSYVLDEDPQKDALIERVAKARGLEIRKFVNDVDGVKASVEQWVASYRDAEFIVTDSFHGTVFSIIYNKPFIAICNEHRGASRFRSLLGIFGLEHRLISSPDELTEELIASSIDYSRVNAIKEQWQKKSKEFLSKI